MARLNVSFWSPDCFYPLRSLGYLQLCRVFGLSVNRKVKLMNLFFLSRKLNQSNWVQIKELQLSNFSFPSLLLSFGNRIIRPPGPNYMPSLYGLRPQDTAAAYSQLLHPMSMYGPAATAAAGGLPKDAASSLLFPGTAGALAGFGPSPFASLHPLLAARSQYGGAGASLLDYQRSLAAASSSSSSAPTSNSTSPYAAWPAAAYPYLLPDLMAASSPQAAAAAAAGIKRHSSEMEAAMELNAKRMRYAFFFFFCQHLLPCKRIRQELDRR